MIQLEDIKLDFGYLLRIWVSYTINQFDIENKSPSTIKHNYFLR